MNDRASFSRRRLALGFAIILAFPVVPAFAGRKRSAGEHPAKKFLGSIYQRYLGKSSAAAGIPLTDAQSVRSYFTYGLASLILEDRAAATTRGESPVLDGYPFIGHPEWDISDLSIDVKDTGAPKTVGTVTLVNFGKPEKVVLELLPSSRSAQEPSASLGARCSENPRETRNAPSAQTFRRASDQAKDAATSAHLGLIGT